MMEKSVAESTLKNAGFDISKFDWTQAWTIIQAIIALWKANSATKLNLGSHKEHCQAIKAMAECGCD